MRICVQVIKVVNLRVYLLVVFIRKINLVPIEWIGTLCRSKVCIEQYGVLSERFNLCSLKLGPFSARADFLAVDNCFIQAKIRIENDEIGTIAKLNLSGIVEI